MTEQQPGQGSPTGSGGAAGGISDAAGRLSQDVASLVRGEIDRTKAELVATVRGAGLGSAAVAGAGVCGALTLVMAHQTVLRTLERRWPAHRAAAALTCAYAACAAALAWYGCDKLQQARAASQQALEQMGRETADS
jgi:hypothetical protein